MFGRPFMPGLQAAAAGVIPGVVQEDIFGGVRDPRAAAAMLGAPVPMSPGGGIGAGTPQVRAYNTAQMGDDNGVIPQARSSVPMLDQNDPRGMMAARGGVGAPAMPMGDMPPQGMASAGDERAYGGILNPQDARAGMVNLPQTGGMFAGGPKQHKGLFPGKDWKTWVGQILPAAIAGFTASQGNPAGKAMLDHLNRMREAQQDAQLKMRLPQQVGSSVVQWNPDTNSYTSLFRDPSTPEAYAIARGFQPGTPEFQAEVQNYRLGSWSDPAVAAKVGLEGVKTDNKLVVQDDQQSWRDTNREDWQTHGRQMQDDRQADYRSRPHSARPSAAPKTPQSENALYTDIMRRWTAGQNVNPREKEFVRAYNERHKPRAGGGRSSGGGSDLVGQVYERNGRRIQYSKSKGGYVDLATGQPVQ